MGKILRIFLFVREYNIYGFAKIVEIFKSEYQEQCFVIIPFGGLVLFEMLGLSSSFSKVFVPSPLSTARNLGIAADCDEVFTRTNFALNAFGNRIKIAKTKATFIMHPRMPFSAIFKK